MSRHADVIGHGMLACILRATSMSCTSRAMTHLGARQHAGLDHIGANVEQHSVQLRFHAVHLQRVSCCTSEQWIGLVCMSCCTCHTTQMAQKLPLDASDCS